MLILSSDHKRSCGTQKHLGNVETPWFIRMCGRNQDHTHTNTQQTLRKWPRTHLFNINLQRKEIGQQNHEQQSWSFCRSPHPQRLMLTLAPISNLFQQLLTEQLCFIANFIGILFIPLCPQSKQDWSFICLCLLNWWHCHQFHKRIKNVCDCYQTSNCKDQIQHFAGPHQKCNKH